MTGVNRFGFAKYTSGNEGANGGNNGSNFDNFHNDETKLCQLGLVLSVVIFVCQIGTVVKIAKKFWLISWNAIKLFNRVFGGNGVSFDGWDVFGLLRRGIASGNHDGRGKAIVGYLLYWACPFSSG